jgi:hypothetical protein
MRALVVLPLLGPALAVAQQQPASDSSLRSPAKIESVSGRAGLVFGLDLAEALYGRQMLPQRARELIKGCDLGIQSGFICHSVTSWFLHQ